MSTAHLLTDLTWETCADQLFCDVEHHLPDTTLMDAETLTRDLIINLFALDSEPPTKINSRLTRLWLNSNGDYHRDYDLPAVEYADGSCEWWFNGMQHRSHGPALTLSIGYEEWWGNHKLDRTDGPAITYPDGTHEWWLHGTQYSEMEHYQKTKP